MTTPLNLSKAATEEILGDNLCLVFAIGKDGSIVRFYPEGVEPPVGELGESESISLEINTRIPNYVDASQIQEISTRSNTGCICIVGGKPVRC